jgi:hypothetical protein
VIVESAEHAGGAPSADALDDRHLGPILPEVMWRRCAGSRGTRHRVRFWRAMRSASHTNLVRPKWIGSSRPYRALAAPARGSGDPEGCVRSRGVERRALCGFNSADKADEVPAAEFLFARPPLMPTRTFDPAHVGRQSGDGPFVARLASCRLSDPFIVAPTVRGDRAQSAQP